MDAYQNSHYRLSDSERGTAMGELDAHYAAGRLGYEDYQERLDVVRQASYQGDIQDIFRDLPPMDVSVAPVDVARLPENTYTVVEIADARRKAQHTRGGLFALSTLAGIGLMAGFNNPLFFLLPAVVFILLYVMKVGPDRWHTPSPRQLAAQRRQTQRMLHSAELEQRRQARKLRQEELKDAALEIAQRSVKRIGH
ncbi:MAG: DUF1707 domain-containing protein [Corynebacterium sp.]|nr:DUF1707 domain-containing protein [Corynebacterium sp.]